MVHARAVSRNKSHPSLLITSARGTPEWISPLEAQKLCVDLSEFTCCQRNHKFGDKVVSCDRNTARSILEALIESKVFNLFKNNKIKLARLFSIGRQWWLRGGKDRDHWEEGQKGDLKAWKTKRLKWDEDDCSWKDRYGVSILAYAVIGDREDLVKEILETSSKSDRIKQLDWKFSKEGVVEIGVPGHSAALHLAMMLSSVKVVELLIRHGMFVCVCVFHSLTRYAHLHSLNLLISLSLPLSRL